MAMAQRVAAPPPEPARTTELSYSLRDLTKRFPGVVAVDAAQLAVGCGELHGIIGRNGAGKSVLVGMIAGVVQPTAGHIAIGQIELEGTRYGRAVAKALGVALVPQEPRFARKLSVVDNLFMGRQPTVGLGFVDRRAMREAAEAVIERLGVDARMDSRIGDLPIETQQLLAFGRAMWIDQAKVVLLDEITASLGRNRRQSLLVLLRELLRGDRALSVTLISHHIAEVMSFCDRVTVMRDGQSVATIDVPDTTERELARWIVGDQQRIVAATVLRPVAPPASAPVIEVERLGDGRWFDGLDVAVRPGEVVGFAGLDGSGKEQALHAIFGLRRIRSGAMRMNGRPLAPRNPSEALRAGIAYLPKHREAEAIVQRQSVEVNTLLSAYGRLSSRLGFVDRGRGRRLAEERTAALEVKTPSIEAAIDGLSGGNKQKVLINRLALTRPRLFLLNEPTRGVDIASKPAILATMRDELAREAGVIVISESEDELVAICDRILVFYRGRVIRALARGAEDFTVKNVYEAIQGVQP